MILSFLCFRSAAVVEEAVVSYLSESRQSMSSTAPYFSWQKPGLRRRFLIVMSGTKMAASERDTALEVSGQRQAASKRDTALKCQSKGCYEQLLGPILLLVATQSLGQTYDPLKFHHSFCSISL